MRRTADTQQFIICFFSVSDGETLANGAQKETRPPTLEMILRQLRRASSVFARRVGVGFPGGDESYTVRPARRLQRKCLCFFCRHLLIEMSKWSWQRRW